ncbi:hypothetical protein HS088_TW07G01386 [Tripterygium wilfordii]|uniref:F-box/LRR-repeat protein 10 n=1 Tax=Tripterygium wilfordii TaxID=458696 RepID=A0A7J7DHH0_TRIWF|nr:F-box/LRR-repeat protein 10-like [Tripterygium wilfordii]KAF5745792.1 hypothetical protein HS088_TW07G01386 [Tripterygium wilfordii]
MSSREDKSSEAGVEQLPSAVLATIMMNLDLRSICSMACTCKSCKACASHILSFLPNINLLDIAITTDLLRPLLPPNPHLRSLKLDCNRLDDSSIDLLLRPSLRELSLRNCMDFSGKLLSEIGRRCSDLRSLCLGSVAGKRGRIIDIYHLKELISRCTQLEVLVLMFDFSLFDAHLSAQVWAPASDKLTSLEIGHVSSIEMTKMLSPDVGPVRSASILPCLRRLCISVDYITDAMVGRISEVLISLTHLDLRDAPSMEPPFDLTNAGIGQINRHGNLKHFSLVRSQEFLDTTTYFNHVNDLGFLLMADKCANLESICLGGFRRVTDTGFKTLLHSCSKLYKFRVFWGVQLTDLVFHDISATSLSLTHVSLRCCHLMSNHAIVNLVSNMDLKVLDLRACKNLGDEALRAIGVLPTLKILILDGTDISDVGLSSLRGEVISSLVSLSLRGCKRLTDRCIPALFDGSSELGLRELDLSNLPNLSDDGILSLARYRVPITTLRLRNCRRIGDVSVMALASMQIDEGSWQGSSLRLLDICECGGITQLAFRWLKKPYFRRLRWLGVTGSINRDIVDALARNRPFLHVACRGEELRADTLDESDGMGRHDHFETDELEQLILDGWNYSDDEGIVDAENYGEFMDE